MLQEVKVYTIDAMSSNSMKSPNPYSGIHETETAKCLDTMCLDPSCNQGGHMVVIALEGNGIRPSHLGNGFSIDAPMYTLNTIEHHCVCYAIDQQGGKTNCGYAEDIMPTLCSDSHGTPHAVCFRKSSKPHGPDGEGERWVEDGTTNTLNCFEFGNDTRTPEIVLQQVHSYSIDCRNTRLNEEVNTTLQAKEEGGWSVNFLSPVLIVNGDDEH